MPLRVATYNIHGGIGADGVRDYRRIGRHLDSLQVDIALLQEVDARQDLSLPGHDPSSLCQRPEQTLAAAPAIDGENGWYGNALLSRFPVIESRSIDVSQLGFEPRNIQLAKIDVNGRCLRVINTHKGLKTAERQLQFERLYEQIDILAHQPDLIVLGGDFNEWQFFSRAFNRINDVLTPIKTRSTFPSRWPIFRLDRLWVKAPGCRVSGRVVKNAQTRLHSDHCPVIVDIHFD